MSDSIGLIVFNATGKINVGDDLFGEVWWKSSLWGRFSWLRPFLEPSLQLGLRNVPLQIHIKHDSVNILLLS